MAAVVLAELDAEVDFFCALGNDVAGHAALAQLEDRGVRVHVAWRDEPTRRAVTLLEPDGERTIITIGERLEPRGDDELDWEVLCDASSVYFTAGDAGALAHARRAPIVVASPRARTVLETNTIDAIVFSESDPDESAWARARRAARAAARGDRGRARRALVGRLRRSLARHAAPGTAARLATAAATRSRPPSRSGWASGGSVADAAALGAQAGARALTRVGVP